MQITRGKISKGIKTVIYGPEGIGKTTLAAQFPGAVFIDTEGSTKHMDVARLPLPSSWQMILEEARWVRDNPDEVGTLILDTADWAEQMEIKELCDQKHWDGLEDPGYGKGYTYSAERFGELLNIFNEIVEKGVNVVVTAHAWLRKVELPEEMGSYDHWEMKTSKKVAPMIREWGDMVLFLNYKTVIVNVDGKGQAKGKNKAQGGRRMMHTNHTPFWDAKNRFDLPDDMPLSYDGIARIFDNQEKTHTNAVKSEPVIREPEPVPGVPDHDSNADPGFIAEKDLFFEIGNDVFWVKKGETVPQKFLKKGSREIKKTEYAKRVARKEKEKPPEEEAVPTIASAEDAKKIPEGYVEPDPRIPKKLRDLMIQDKIDEWEIQTLVASKGYFPFDMHIQDYPEDFINGWAIAYWPQVKESIVEMRKKQEIEYK